MDLLTKTLLEQYVQASLVGVGAIKGKNCTISSIAPITGGNRVTYLWTDDDGVEHTSTMDVKDGKDGVDGTDGKDGADGTQVVANPTLVGTEEELNSIQIGTDKFKIVIGDSTEIALPSYYVAEFIDTLQKVEALASANTFGFGFASDLHFSPKGSGYSESTLRDRIFRMMRAYAKFSKMFPLAVSILGGDYMQPSTDETKNTWQSGVNNITEINEAMSVFDGEKIVMCGNHEKVYSGVSGDTVGMSEDDFYNFCSKKYATGKIEKASKVTYYQIDDVDNVCFIYLDSFYEPSVAKHGADIDAIMAKNTNQYPYIVVSHYCMSRATDGVFVGVKAIIDYIKGKSGVIIAYVGGHNHGDWHAVYNNTLVVSVLNSGAWSNNESEDGVTYSKTNKTANESAFSIFTIDKDLGKLHCTRFGAGVDRVFNYNDTSGEIGDSTDYTYSVTQNLTDVTSNYYKRGTNGNATIVLTPKTSGYQINATVTIGGVDVTSQVWDSTTKTITITNASGNIVITAYQATGYLFDVVSASEVKPYYNTTMASVSTNGNNFEATLYKSGSGISIEHSWDNTQKTWVKNNQYVVRCDDYEIDISDDSNLLPGVYDLAFYDGSTSLGHKGLQNDETLAGALALMKSTSGYVVTMSEAVAGLWNSCNKLVVTIRASSQSGSPVALAEEKHINVTNFRIEEYTA